MLNRVHPAEAHHRAVGQTRQRREAEQRRDEQTGYD